MFDSIVQFLAFVVSTGVVTTVFTTAWGTVQTKRIKREAAGHLALQLAAQLEQFAHDAASNAADVEYYRSSGGVGGFRCRPIVDLSPYPAETEAWRALEKGLRNRAISFPMYVNHWRGRLQFELDHRTPPESTEHSAYSLEGNIQLCIGALDLARDLRKEYGWWGPTPAVHAERRWLKAELQRIEAGPGRPPRHDSSAAEL